MATHQLYVYTYMERHLDVFVHDAQKTHAFIQQIFSTPDIVLGVEDHNSGQSKLKKRVSLEPWNLMQYAFGGKKSYPRHMSQRLCPAEMIIPNTGPDTFSCKTPEENACKVSRFLIKESSSIIIQQQLKENNFKGITAFPVSEDLMEWGADIEGLQNTFWHGLFFQLKINFTSQYNFVPPVVKFLTIPFHPSVDQNTGRACIDILDDPDKWNTSYTLSSILLTLQVMLSNPVLENPVNLEAAQMLIKDESLYKQEVLRLFNQPTQLRNNTPEFPKDPDKLIRSTKAISFNDYYKTWSGIATSKATEYYGSPCKVV
ncbi:ubiquitin-conjugating enzyme E2 U-like [Neomonachus schauinslandi]|uniref:Ubiquitin-conjugating enzyme E2 U n=1 Tax=Neomonachus schauinslandi TaxID=29088 RepID=A0A2Y9I8A0_NEOSC|nr:ubiquitin-conjugating enzyme E2 U-like [Neomonachus schauinslandi]